MKRIIFLIIFCIVGISFTYYMIRPETEEKLPVINPIDLEDEMVDPELLRVGYGHRVGDFSFANQEGKTITQEDVKGNVFVVEYFFTTCKTICPVMNVQMRRVHEKFEKIKGFKILSFTVDPDTDDVAQMKRYADEHGASADSWHFLTGSRADLYRLARRSFFVLKPAEAENQGDVGSDFIHTNNFVLVDKKMRIRGYYDGTSAKEVDQLMHDIEILLKQD